MTSILFRPQSVNRACHLATIIGATILVPCHVVKSLQLIWRSGTRRFHLRVPNLQMNWSDLTYRYVTKIVFLVMATRVTCPIESHPSTAPLTADDPTGHAGNSRYPLDVTLLVVGITHGGPIYHFTVAVCQVSTGIFATPGIPRKTGHIVWWDH